MARRVCLCGGALTASGPVCVRACVRSYVLMPCVPSLADIREEVTVGVWIAGELGGLAILCPS